MSAEAELQAKVAYLEHQNNTLKRLVCSLIQQRQHAAREQEAVVQFLLNDLQTVVAHHNRITDLANKALDHICS